MNEPDLSRGACPSLTRPSLTPVRPSIKHSVGGAGDVTVIRGGNVSLLCDADGVPRPAVSWLKDGRPITGQPGVAVLDEGRLLQITAAKVSDTGRYSCVAVNAAGQADSRQDVSVHGETRPHATTVQYCSTVHTVL